MLAANKKQPYLFQFFNVHGYYHAAARGLNQFLLPLVEALNEKKNKYLPKYIIYTMDKDFVDVLKGNMIESGLVMGAALHYLIRQIDILINRRKHVMMHKKPGAFNDDNPKIIWVRMIK